VVAPLMLAGYVAMAELAARWAPLRRWVRIPARKDPLAAFD